MDLNKDDLIRYRRQLILPEWGEKAQHRIKNATVLVAGAGGLGSPAAMYLAAAGIGTLIICDNDRLELSNLNRQIIHAENSIGTEKTISAAERLRNINKSIIIVPIQEKIERESIPKIAGEAQVIVDCMDNFEARYVLNQYCVHSKIPFIHAGIHGLSGQVTFLHPPQTPCLHCIFPEAPPAAEIPVLGAVAGIIGAMEALEAIKYITGEGDLLTNRLLIFEGASMQIEEIPLSPTKDCPVCSGI
jgi:molybdopterin-synthase adenylyltransferase